MKYSMTWANDSLGIPMFVSISSLGIALNQVSIEALGSPKKIIMGFDEEKKILGSIPNIFFSSSKPIIIFLGDP
ncbi:MAG: hypothetical protein EOM67_16970, partial [Spirochaetia bacterium]|nr:hypothetical protein [Spirochaetia bacterium]